MRAWQGKSANIFPFNQKTLNKTVAILKKGNVVGLDMTENQLYKYWLMQNSFHGKNNQIIPEMTDDVVEMVSGRYIELYEKLIGKKITQILKQPGLVLLQNL